MFIRGDKTSVVVSHDVEGWRYPDISSSSQAEEGSHPLPRFRKELAEGQLRNVCLTSLALDDMKPSGGEHVVSVRVARACDERDWGPHSCKAGVQTWV